MKYARLLGTALAVAAVPTSLAPAAVTVADSGLALPASGTVATQVVDLDGDGHLDIVTGSTAGGGTVVVRLGDGDGGFTTPTGLTDQTADKAAYVLVADADGDGRQDLVTAAGSGSAVYIWHRLSGPALAFESIPTTVNDPSVGGQVRSVTVADVTYDGATDLIISGSAGARYAPQVSGAYPGGYGGWITMDDSRGTRVVDIDGDSGLDVVSMDVTSVPGVWMLSMTPVRNSGPDMWAGGGMGVPGPPRDLVLADLNHDGRSDAVYARGDSSATPINVMWGNGTIFPSYDDSLTFGTPTSATRLVTADVDGDGNTDVVAATSAGPLLLLGTGTRSGGAFAAPVALGTGLSGDQVAVGDLDEDGLPDLVSASASGVDVRLNTSPVAATVAVDAPFGGTLLGDHTDRTVTLTNTGSVALTPGAPTITGLDANQVTVTSSTCAVAVPAGHSCTVGLRYAPVIGGALAATLTFPGATPTPDTALSLALSGTGQVGGFLEGPGIEDAGQFALGATATRTLTYTNTGDRPLTLPAAFFEGTSDWTITSDACTGSLAAGATCTVTVAVTPTTLGAQHAVLVVGGLSTSLEATVVAAPVTGDRNPVTPTPVPASPAPVTTPAPVTAPTPATTAPAVTKPRITYRGVLRRGVRLTASATATGTPTPTLTYRWQRCTGTRCITVGTGPRRTLTAADRGKRLTVTVTATNSAGTAKAISARTATVKAR